MIMLLLHRIIVTTLLCLAAVGVEPLFATESSQATVSPAPPTYEEYLTAKTQYCLEALTLAQGIHDKASADAAAARWAELDSCLHADSAIELYHDIPTEEELTEVVARISAIFGNTESIFRELTAEKIRLSKVNYFNSEALAVHLGGSPTNAYPRDPATPEVAQLFTDYYKKLLVSFIGENNLIGGPGYSTETAWVITSTPENEKNIERHIIRKSMLNYAEHMRVAEGFRYNMPSSGRQRMEGVTYLFHLYHVVPNNSLTAYHLKQYFRIEKAVQEKSSLKSETEILTIAAREVGGDIKGYTARFEAPYYHVELTEFDDPMTLGGGPAFKINAYTGEIVERYFTE